MISCVFSIGECNNVFSLDLVEMPMDLFEELG